MIRARAPSPRRLDPVEKRRACRGVVLAVEAGRVEFLQLPDPVLPRELVVVFKKLRLVREVYLIVQTTVRVRGVGGVAGITVCDVECIVPG